MIHEALLKIKALCTDPNATEDNALNDVFSVANAALTALSEPFDPLKHLSGWVKDETRVMDTWYKGDYLKGEWSLSHHDFGEHHYVLSLIGGDEKYRGPLPTLDFFHALCGALNIKA